MAALDRLAVAVAPAVLAFLFGYLAGVVVGDLDANPGLLDQEPAGSWEAR